MDLIKNISNYPFGYLQRMAAIILFLLLSISKATKQISESFPNFNSNQTISIRSDNSSVVRHSYRNVHLDSDRSYSWKYVMSAIGILLSLTLVTIVILLIREVENDDSNVDSDLTKQIVVAQKRLVKQRKNKIKILNI